MSSIEIMDKIKTDKNTLRKFGLTMGTAFAVFTLFIFLKRGELNLVTPALSLFFLAQALILPVTLKYSYIFWMKLAFVLGWFNMRLLLGIIFYAAFAPVGLFMRLFRIDPLERKTDKNIRSYWKPKENKAFAAADYERQF